MEYVTLLQRFSYINIDHELAALFLENLKMLRNVIRELLSKNIPLEHFSSPSGHHGLLASDSYNNTRNQKKVTRNNQFSGISTLKKEDKNISEQMFYEDDLMQSKYFP